MVNYKKNEKKKYYKNGKTTIKTETDYAATSNAIREAVKNSEYNQWIDKRHCTQCRTAPCYDKP